MDVKDSESRLAKPLPPKKKKKKFLLLTTWSLENLVSEFPHVAHSYFLSIMKKLLGTLGLSSHPNFLSWEMAEISEAHTMPSDPQRPLLSEIKR